MDSMILCRTMASQYFHGSMTPNGLGHQCFHCGVKLQSHQQSLPNVAAAGGLLVVAHPARDLSLSLEMRRSMNSKKSSHKKFLQNTFIFSVVWPGCPFSSARAVTSRMPKFASNFLGCSGLVEFLSFLGEV